MPAFGIQLVRAPKCEPVTTASVSREPHDVHRKRMRAIGASPLPASINAANSVSSECRHALHQMLNLNPVRAMSRGVGRSVVIQRRMVRHHAPEERFDPCVACRVIQHLCGRAARLAGLSCLHDARNHAGGWCSGYRTRAGWRLGRDDVGWSINGHGTYSDTSMVQRRNAAPALGCATTSSCGGSAGSSTSCPWRYGCDALIHFSVIPAAAPTPAEDGGAEPRMNAGDVAPGG